MSTWRLGPATSLEFRTRIFVTFASLPAYAALATACGAAPPPWWAPPVSWPVRAAAAMFAAGGLLLRLWGTAVLSANAVLQAEVSTARLVDSGPFGWLRNPLYLGTQLVIGGWSLWYGLGPASVFAVFHALRFGRIVRREEHELHGAWGPQFEDYCRRVNRWTPWPNGCDGLIPGLAAPAAWFGNAPFAAMAIALASAAAGAPSALFFPALAAGLAIAGGWIAVRTRQPKRAGDGSP